MDAALELGIRPSKCRSRAVLLLGFTLSACGAKQPEPVSVAHASDPAPEPAPSDAGVSPVAAAESQDATPSDAGPLDAGMAPSAAAGTEAATTLACPADMQLVDADYCSKVEHKCVDSWYDKSNKKVVCEKFEPPAACVGDKTHKRYCIDRYEWPNKKGARPEVMNRFHQAEVKCAAVGKRLCSESEWTLACEGPELKPFPYGYVRDVDKCHGDVEWDSPNMTKVAKRDPDELARLWKGKRSGQPQCVSDFGVYDLPGNADEVVYSETFDPGFRGRYDSVHSGGPWYKGVRNQCRPKIYTHDEGFYYYFLSFRCCAEADGKPSEPLTLKQKKDDWSFERVERSAGFTRDGVRALWEKRDDQGSCGCKAHDVLCNTMCGTLLAPSAVDYVRPPPSEATPAP